MGLLNRAPQATDLQSTFWFRTGKPPKSILNIIPRRQSNGLKLL